jgi:hypothetical protein
MNEEFDWKFAVMLLLLVLLLTGGTIIGMLEAEWAR